MKKPFFLCAALLVAAIMAVSCSGPSAPAANTPDSALESESFYMDTIVRQLIYAEDDTIINENNQIFYDLEQRVSKTIKTSDVYKLNNASGKSVEVSGDTVYILQETLAAYAQTGGAYNPALGNIMEAWNFKSDSPRVPPEEQIAELLKTTDANAITISQNTVNLNGMAIDLGGAAKGYALDLIAANLAEKDIENALIYAGGAIYASGKKPDGTAFKIGIRNPLGLSNEYMGTLILEDAFLSTSGTYERGFTADGKYYHHLIDPKTGMPAKTGLLSVSVICDNGLLSDIYSTALFVMGPEEGLRFAEQNSIDALFITETDAVLMTDGFEDKYSFEVVSGSTYNAAQ